MWEGKGRGGWGGVGWVFAASHARAPLFVPFAGALSAFLPEHTREALFQLLCDVRANTPKDRRFFARHARSLAPRTVAGAVFALALGLHALALSSALLSVLSCALVFSLWTLAAGLTALALCSTLFLGALALGAALSALSLFFAAGLAGTAYVGVAGTQAGVGVLAKAVRAARGGEQASQGASAAIEAPEGAEEAEGGAEVAKGGAEAAKGGTEAAKGGAEAAEDATVAKQEGLAKAAAEEGEQKEQAAKEEPSAAEPSAAADGESRPGSGGLDASAAPFAPSTLPPAVAAAPEAEGDAEVEEGEHEARAAAPAEAPSKAHPAPPARPPASRPSPSLSTSSSVPSAALSSPSGLSAASAAFPPSATPSPSPSAEVSSGDAAAERDVAGTHARDERVRTVLVT